MLCTRQTYMGQGCWWAVWWRASTSDVRTVSRRVSIDRKIVHIYLCTCVRYRHAHIHIQYILFFRARTRTYTHTWDVRLRMSSLNQTKKIQKSLIFRNTPFLLVSLAIFSFESKTINISALPWALWIWKRFKDNILFVIILIIILSLRVTLKFDIR